MSLRRDLVHGAMRDVLSREPSDSLDSVVTDPPYALTGETGQTMPGRYADNQRASAGGFMGLAWDKSLPTVEDWREAYRVLKPGAHLVAFGGTRTYHRLATIIEDAGFVIRDMLGWVYLSGFPKSLDVSKAIDKRAGAKRRVVGSSANGVGNLRGTLHGDEGFAAARSKVFDLTDPATAAAAAAAAGWGTALKPCWEPIVLARKPFKGMTVADCVLTHRTAAINVDGCRIPFAAGETAGGHWSGDDGTDETSTPGYSGGFTSGGERSDLGRWPGNIIAAPGCFPPDTQRVFDLGAWFAKQEARYNAHDPYHRGVLSGLWPVPKPDGSEKDAGLGGRACGKWDKSRKEGLPGGDNPRNRGAAEKRLNVHPTVKPVALMRFLARLVTPKGGTLIEPFAGSGTTLVAAIQERFGYVAAEREAEYVEIAKARAAHALNEWEGVPIAPTGAPLPLFDAAQTGAPA